MTKKLRVAVIFGGTNTEHEVSLQSAKAVLSHLDPNKFDILPIKITKDNRWVALKMLQNPDVKELALAEITQRVGEMTTSEATLSNNSIDIVFPVLHGPYGEDGTIQGLLEMLRLPYVGCGVAASAVCMDKVLQKNICESYGIPVAPYYFFTAGEWSANKAATLKNLLSKFEHRYPLFIKPANQGSSVGISKAHDQNELTAGIEVALTRDLKVIVEMAVPNAREIECSVLGPTHQPKSSILGEIIPGNEFYDYNAKYVDDNSIPVIPAKLPPKLATQIRETAQLAFRALDCSGLARVDFLLDNNTSKFYLNELNTMPGFTPISMFPKLWESSGVSYSNLLTQLIELGLARHRQKSLLNLQYC